MIGLKVCGNINDYLLPWEPVIASLLILLLMVLLLAYVSKVKITHPISENSTKTNVLQLLPMEHHDGFTKQSLLMRIVAIAIALIVFATPFSFFLGDTFIHLWRSQIFGF